MLQKVLRLVGDLSLILGGVLAGILLTLYGTVELLGADPKSENVPAIFNLPPAYYIVGILVLFVLVVLLRKAAGRIS